MTADSEKQMKKISNIL